MKDWRGPTAVSPAPENFRGTALSARGHKGDAQGKLRTGNSRSTENAQAGGARPANAMWLKRSPLPERSLLPPWSGLCLADGRIQTPRRRPHARPGYHFDPGTDHVGPLPPALLRTGGPADVEGCRQVTCLFDCYFNCPIYPS